MPLDLQVLELIRGSRHPGNERVVRHAVGIGAVEERAALRSTKRRRCRVRVDDDVKRSEDAVHLTK